jgi:poly(A) polymerase
MKLEYVDSLTLAHPFVKGFEQVSHCTSEEEVRAVAQGEVSEAIKKRKQEDVEGVDGASAVYSTTFYIGLAIEPKQRACFVGIVKPPDRSCSVPLQLGLSVPDD